MRKLILEIQTSIDGFIASNDGTSDWMVWNYTPKHWNWDEALQKYHTDITHSCDCILLSSKMAGGFHDHWDEAARDAQDSRYKFAEVVARMKKVVFSRKLKESLWRNTTIAGGDLVSEVTKLKSEQGKNIIVYGGATLVSSLIEARLIDEFHLLINPTAIGSGMAIFHGLGSKQDFFLNHANAFSCGVAVLHYTRIE